MHILFLDESGSPEAQKGLFGLGGVVVRDSDWRTLRQLWQDVLQAHNWPPDREIKWHGIRKGEVPDALADAVFATLASAPITCYVTVMDLTAGPLRFRPPSTTTSAVRKTRTRPRSCFWQSDLTTSSRGRTTSG
jgi:hypothetical protein